MLSLFIIYDRPLRKHLACSRDRTNISGLCSDEEIFEQRLMHRENSTNAAWVIVKCARLILIYLGRRLENEPKRHTLDDRGTLEWYCGLDMHQSCYLWILIFRFWIPFHFSSALGPLLDFGERCISTCENLHNIDFCYRLFPIVCAGSSLYILLCYFFGFCNS